MSKQQFKSQVSICDEAIKAFKEAIQIDPDNADLYQSGLDYTENIKKASEAIVKAYEVVEPAKAATPKDKIEDTKKEEKPKRSRKSKTAKETAPADSKPAVDETQPMVEASTEENSDLFAMFDD